jgi:acetyltransferase-like isoleucine patch superfamily enzyme
MIAIIRQRLRSWMLKRHVTAGANVRLRQFCRIINNQRDPAAIVLGNNVVVDGELLVFADRGKIVIGSDVFIGEGSRIWSGSEISIGDRVLISHGVNILDSSFHDLSAHRRRLQFQRIFVDKVNEVGSITTKAIRIDDDAWIGFGASILKGVHIGMGAVVAAGAMVTKDVAPFTVVGGPTAQVIGTSFE